MGWGLVRCSSGCGVEHREEIVSSCIVVNILGQEYRIIFGQVTDPRLETADGYCDFTTKQIVVRSDIPETVDTVADLDVYKNKVLRHEIIHAFLYESGLDSNSWGSNEEVVDWIALQLVKIVQVVDKVNNELKKGQKDV